MSAQCPPIPAERSVVPYKAPGSLMVLEAAPPQQDQTAATAEAAPATPGVIHTHALPLSSIAGELRTGCDELAAGLRQSAGALQRLGRVAILGVHHIAGRAVYEAPRSIAALREQCAPAQVRSILGASALRAWDSWLGTELRQGASERLHKCANSLYSSPDQ